MKLKLLAETVSGTSERCGHNFIINVIIEIIYNGRTAAKLPNLGKSSGHMYKQRVCLICINHLV